MKYYKHIDRSNAKCIMYISYDNDMWAVHGVFYTGGDLDKLTKDDLLFQKKDVLSRYWISEEITEEEYFIHCI